MVYMDEVTSTFWTWRTALEMENISRMKLECKTFRAPSRKFLLTKLTKKRASEIRSMEEEKFKTKVRHVRGLYTCSSNEQLDMFRPPPESLIEGFIDFTPNNQGAAGDTACNYSPEENVY